jgi:hypothetical protein
LEIRAAIVSSPPRQSISPATAAEWRRRREASVELSPPPDDESARNGSDGQKASNTSDGKKAGNGFRVPAYAAALRSTDTTTDGFAESQRAGLALMASLAKTTQQGGDSQTGNHIALPAPDLAEEQSVKQQSLLSVVQPPAAATRFHVPRLLLAILTVQAVLSARLIHANTAFEDEALYLWAGRLEWTHWLHGTLIPPFPTYFSGAPIIYPPLAALADSVGGLSGARILSLCFMLGATVMLWKVTERLYGYRAAFFAAGLWAVLGPTQRLGAFATYDAMALFLIALAAWCVTSGRGRRDATGWMLAGACALVLANATKYASALFDPTVAALAFLTGYPPGGKVAGRRVAYLLAIMAAAIIILLQVGQGWYIAGIDQTTLTRHYGGTPVPVILRSAWEWTAIVIVPAVFALAIAFKTEHTVPGRWLLAILASTALLVPIEQARIHTYTALSKHVDFGAWFAVIAAGYAADCAVRWLRGRGARIAAASVCTTALVPVALSGISQADSFFGWPGAGNLIPAVRQLTTNGGRFLADNTPVLEYYMPDVSWRKWSSVYGITLPSGRRVPEIGNDVGPYRALLAEHYFNLVILAFTDKPMLDNSIARYLQSDNSYRFVGAVPFNNPGAHGSYLIWMYRGGP